VPQPAFPNAQQGYPQQQHHARGQWRVRSRGPPRGPYRTRPPPQRGTFYHPNYNMNAIDELDYYDYDNDMYYDDQSEYGINEFQYDVSLLQSIPGKKLLIDIIIPQHNKPVQSLVDCGATITLVRPEFTSAITRPHKINVRFANGAFESLTTQTLLRFSIDGVAYEHWASVSPSLPYNVVLGTDFLGDRAVIDFIDKIITLRSEITHESFAVQTEATRLDLYRQYAIEQRDKAIAHINATVPHQSTRTILLDAIQQQWHNNKDEWHPCDFPSFTLDTTTADTPFQAAYHTSQLESQFLEEKVNQWIFKSIARLSLSPYGAPTLLVPKKEYQGRPSSDLFRAAVNYRRLNRITVPSKYPLPFLEDILDRARGDTFSVIDCEDAYHQVRIREDHIPRSAFNAGTGHYEFTRMQYGMVNAGNHLQCHTELMLLEEPQLLHKYSEVFVDDNLIFTTARGNNPIDEHNRILRITLKRYLDHNYKINFIKSEWAKKEVNFGGRTVSQDGIKLLKSKVDALTQLPHPRSFDEARKIIGLCVWHQPWINHFCDIMEPIFAVMRLESYRKWSPSLWAPGSAPHRAFEKIKSAIANATTRSRSGPGTYHIWCDYSQVAVAYHLVREHNGEKFLMAYGSHTLSGAERSYSTPKGEFFAIWKAIRRFWWYIFGRKVEIHIDCEAWPVTELAIKNPRDVENRWLRDVSIINPDAVWIRGVKNKVSDCMTRLIPITSEVNSITTIPDEFVDDLLKSHHAGPLGAHASATTMYANLKDRYRFNNMFSRISEFCHNCDFCQRFKEGPRETRSPLFPVPIPNRPWQCVGLDIVGPLELRNGEKKFFLIVQDYLLKEIVTKNLNNSTVADDTIRAFEQEICCSGLSGSSITLRL
jgi:hypothetical protein